MVWREETAAYRPRIWKRDCRPNQLGGTDFVVIDGRRDDWPGTTARSRYAQCSQCPGGNRRGLDLDLDFGRVAALWPDLAASVGASKSWAKLAA